jgi:hypothetical protein
MGVIKIFLSHFYFFYLQPQDVTNPRVAFSALHPEKCPYRGIWWGQPTSFLMGIGLD